MALINDDNTPIIHVNRSLNVDHVKTFKNILSSNVVYNIYQKKVWQQKSIITNAVLTNDENFTKKASMQNILNKVKKSKFIHANCYVDINNYTIFPELHQNQTIDANEDDNKQENDANITGSYVNMQITITKNNTNKRYQNKTYVSGEKFKIEFFIKKTIFDQMSEKTQAIICKIPYDVVTEIVSKYNMIVGDCMYGFYYLNEEELINQTVVKYEMFGHEHIRQILNIEGFFQYNNNKCPLVSIQNYDKSIQSSQTNLITKIKTGYKLLHNSISTELGNVLYDNVATFINSSNNDGKSILIEKVTGRTKVWTGESYYYYKNNKLTPKQFDLLYRIAYGLRLFKEPIWPKCLMDIVGLCRKLGAIPDCYKNTDFSIAVNIYETKGEIQPHFEDVKFGFVLVVSLSKTGIHTYLSINLKSNQFNGDINIRIPNNSVVVWNS